MSIGYKRPMSQRLTALVVAIALLFGYYPASPAIEVAQARAMNPTANSSGTAPYDVAIGDLNNDGLKDVAVANFQAGNVGVYYQNGAGTLDAMTTLQEPPSAYRDGITGNPYSVKIVDFDQDGLNDLVATNEFQHQVWLYRQDPALGGLYLWQIGTGLNTSGAHPYSNPYGVDAGDLDTDGDPDVAVAIFENEPDLTNSGSIGTFANLNANLSSVEFVDDNIGLISGWHGLYRTFTGGVNPSTAPAVTSLWESLYVPIDDLSYPETIVNDVSWAGANKFWAVGTNGHVIKTASLGATWEIVDSGGRTLNGVDASSESYVVIVGNGGYVSRTTDGSTFSNDTTESVRNDLYDVENVGSRSWVVGSGGLIALWDYSGGELERFIQSTPTSASLYDMDVWGSDAWVVGAQGTILKSSNISTTSTATWNVQPSGSVARLNGVDFVSSTRGWAVGDAGTILTTSDGGNTWNPQTSGTTKNLNDVAFTDANNGRAVGDGGTVLTTDDGGATWVDASIGNQTPAQPSHVLAPMQDFGMTVSAKNPYAVKIADANSDGKKDMTVAAWSTSNITNYRIGWRGNGLMWDNDTRQEVASGINPAALAVIDYNVDGRDDLATANYTGNSVSIFTQPVLPANGFVNAATLATGQSPVGIASGDVNGDGLEDIAVSNADSNSISVFTKQGATGPYNSAAIFSTSSATSGQPYGMALGDLDNDGMDEVVVAISSPRNGNRVDVFKVTQRPGAPTITSSTHPDSSVYYLNNKPQFTISPPADVDGISGYYWVIDQNSTTIPNPATANWNSSGNVSILNGLTPDGDYYFHAVAKDKLGNVGSSASEVAHYAFKINSTPLIATIQSPGDGATVGGTINVDSTATTSSLFTIDKIEVYLDNDASPQAVLTTAPYRWVWDTSTVAAGTHTVKIVAYDSGNRQATDTNTVTVDNSSVGGPTSGVTRSSLVLSGSQFQTPAPGVIAMDYYNQSTDSWSSVGYLGAGSASVSAIYQFSLPAPSSYLWQKLTITEDFSQAQGAAARYYAYNWATDAWDSVSASQELPFWYVSDTANQVKVKVTAPAWSAHQIDNLALEYKYTSDSTAPSVSGLAASSVNFASDYYSRITFGLSENSYVDATIRDSGGSVIRTMRAAKSAGLPTLYWDLRDDYGRPAAPGDYTVSVRATDLAGNVANSGSIAIGEIQAGSKKWYFAEGSTKGTSDTYVTLYNAGTESAQVTIDYLLDDGHHAHRNYAVAARSLIKVSARSSIGRDRTFGMSISSDKPVTAERSVSTASGGHTAVGTASSSEHWYFADGATTSGREQDITLINPTGVPADVRVTYMFTDGSSKVMSFTMGRHRRSTLDVERYVGGGKKFATHVESTNGVGIVAERTQYFSYAGSKDANVTLGAPALSGAWYFAAGTTAGTSDLYLVVQNPGTTKASIRVNYMLESGAMITKAHGVEPGKRVELRVNSYIGGDKNVGIELLSSRDVVAEMLQYRSAYGIAGGFAGVGATRAGKTWYIPYGSTATGNTDKVSIVNPSSADANVLLKYRQSNGILTTKSVIVKAHSVRVYNAASVLGSDKETALEVISDQDVVAERPTTFNYSSGNGFNNALGYLVR